MNSHSSKNSILFPCGKTYVFVLDLYIQVMYRLSLAVFSLLMLIVVAVLVVGYNALLLRV